MLAIGATLVCGLIVLAPFAVSSGRNTLAFIIYASFNHACHQLPERSFFVVGHPFAVCSRCTGLYAGFTAALLFYPLAGFLKRTYTPARKWLFWAAVPMVVDVGGDVLGIWNNTHYSRFFTGVLLGAVSVFYVMPGIIDLALRVSRRSQTSHKSFALSTTTHSMAAIAAAPSDYSSPERRI
jgi:uncharacterized membrane protein